MFRLITDKLTIVLLGNGQGKRRGDREEGEEIIARQEFSLELRHVIVRTKNKKHNVSSVAVPS